MNSLVINPWKKKNAKKWTEIFCGDSKIKLILKP